MIKYYNLIFVFYFISFIISFYTICSVFNVIEDFYFYFYYFVFSSVLAFISWKVFSYFLRGLKENNKKLYKDIIISIVMIIYIGGSYWVLMFVNDLGSVKKINVESKIYKIQRPTSRASGLFKLRIDNKEVFVEVINDCYKVGDVYKMTVYEGWLGIKYYIPHGGCGYYEKNPNCNKKRKEKEAKNNSDGAK